MAQSDNASPVYVIMLEHIEAIPLSSITPTMELIKGALSSLSELHGLGIVHGDISMDNILVIKESGGLEVMLIDYSSSWLDASQEQEDWEFLRAAEYFAHLVRTILIFSNVSSTWKLTTYSMNRCSVP